MSNEITAAPAASLGEEFKSAWQQLPNKGFFLVLLAAWITLFHLFGNSTLGYVNSPSLLVWLLKAYKGPEAEAYRSDDSHGFLIPIAVVVLLWMKRKQLLARPLRTWTPGLLIVGAALFLHIAGFLIQQPRVSVIGFFLGIYGLMGLAWGPGWLRASLFPMILFIFAVPVGSAAESITFPMRLLVTKLVTLISQNILGINVASDGTRLFKLPNQYQYEVAAACSGIRSLVAIIAVALIYACMVFRSWWRRLVLVASALPLAVIGNTFRLLAIVIASELGGQAEGNAVHESPVWSMLPYIPVMLGLVLIGRWFERQQDRSEHIGVATVQSSTTP